MDRCGKKASELEEPVTVQVGEVGRRKELSCKSVDLVEMLLTILGPLGRHSRPIHYLEWCRSFCARARAFEAASADFETTL